jgi:hypothetical protein
VALKVVPAGDERCDIHNGRKPAQYVCKTCLREFGVDPAQAATAGLRPLRARIRWARRRFRRRIARRDPRVLLATGIALLVVAVLVIAVASLVGGENAQDADAGGQPTEVDVVTALELVPDPGGVGWLTSDGACWVVSIQFGANVHPPGEIAGGLVEATNENATVGAAISLSDSSVSEAECVARIGDALKENF